MRAVQFYSTDKLNITDLSRLEAEAIEIMREGVSEAENPVMLYSVGKDSVVMLHLAKKAFELSHIPAGWGQCAPWFEQGSGLYRCASG